jgi:hypothetical protein
MGYEYGTGEQFLIVAGLMEAECLMIRANQTGKSVHEPGSRA